MHITYRVISNSFHTTYSIFKNKYGKLLASVSATLLFFYFFSPVIKQSIVYFSASHIVTNKADFYFKIATDLAHASLTGIYWLLAFTLLIRHVYTIITISPYNKSLTHLGKSMGILIISILLAALCWGTLFLGITITVANASYYFNINPHGELKEIHYLLSVISIFFLIARTIFVAPLIFKDNQSAVNALKMSWMLTRKASLKIMVMVISALVIVNRLIKFIYHENGYVIKLVLLIGLMTTITFLLLLWLVLYNHVRDTDNRVITNT